MFRQHLNHQRSKNQVSQASRFVLKNQDCSLKTSCFHLKTLPTAVSVKAWPQTENSLYKKIPVRNKCRISQASVSTKQLQPSPAGPQNVTRRAQLRIPPLSLATEMFSWQPFTNKPFRDWITHEEGEKTLGVRLFIRNCNKLNEFFFFLKKPLENERLMKEAPLFPAVAVQPLTQAIWH